MHGGITGKHKVLRGSEHPNFNQKGESRREREERSKKSAALLYLIDIGNHAGLFIEKVALSGRPPVEYEKLDLNSPEGLKKAIKRSQKA